MAKNSAREGANSGGKGARTTTKVKTRPKHGEDHEYDRVDYKEGTVRLSAGLAETVAGMMISAVVGNAKHQRKVKDSPRYTREYQEFAAQKHPPEVRAWVVRNFRDGGPGLGAIESQIEIYIDELSAWMDNALRYHKGHWCQPYCDCVAHPELCSGG